MEVTGIDLFALNVGIVCANIRLSIFKFLV